MGMRRDDFLAMSPAEFAAAADAWIQAEEARELNSWKRARRIAAILIRPHIKKGIPEEKLIPLPCDRAAQRKKKKAPEPSPEVTATRIAAFRQQLAAK